MRGPIIGDGVRSCITTPRPVLRFVALRRRKLLHPNVGVQDLTPLPQRAGLLDELQIHLAPLLLGDGVRLFDRLGPKRAELEATRVIESPAVTHLKHRVVK